MTVLLQQEEIKVKEEASSPRADHLFVGDEKFEIIDNNNGMLIARPLNEKFGALVQILKTEHASHLKLMETKRILDNLQKREEAHQTAYFPKPLLTGPVKKESKKTHNILYSKHAHKPNADKERALVLSHFPNLYSLDYTLQAYQGKLEGKDLAWIARRLFVALQILDLAQIGFNELQLQDVLIEPDLHGLIINNPNHLVDLNRATQFIKDENGNTSLERELPKESALKEAAQLLQTMLGENPRETSGALNYFFESIKDSKKEPYSILKDFDLLLENMWGKRKFKPFALPKEEQIKTQTQTKEE